MRLSGRSKILLRIGTAFTLAFIYIPLIVIVIYAFSESRTFEWPPPGLTLDWFDKAIDNTGARDALWYSVKTGLLATGVALILGTLASLAVARYEFFGRETISFLVILPIALPGIVTGIALNSTFTQVLGMDLGILTIVIAHATFCIVVVYNNVVARLRRSSASFEEASADLGATPWQTFRYVTFPNLRTALVAGALLAFGLSFDEIIVTTFTIGAGDQTLPIWILTNFSRPNNLPIVNAVAVIVILISIIPVYLAHRLTRDEGAIAPGRGGAAQPEPSVAGAGGVP
jgi:putative spermidine/putrescine transport system permease protein